MRKMSVRSIILLLLIVNNIALLFVSMHFYMRSYREEKPKKPSEYEMISFHNYLMRSRYLNYCTSSYNKEDEILEICVYNEEALNLIRSILEEQGFDLNYFKLEISAAEKPDDIDIIYV